MYAAFSSEHMPKPELCISRFCIGVCRVMMHLGSVRLIFALVFLCGVLLPCGCASDSWGATLQSLYPVLSCPPNYAAQISAEGNAMECVKCPPTTRSRNPHSRILSALDFRTFANLRSYCLKGLLNPSRFHQSTPETAPAQGEAHAQIPDVRSGSCVAWNGPFKTAQYTLFENDVSWPSVASTTPTDRRLSFPFFSNESSAELHFWDSGTQILEDALRSDLEIPLSFTSNGFISFWFAVDAEHYGSYVYDGLEFSVDGALAIARVASSDYITASTATGFQKVGAFLYSGKNISILQAPWTRVSAGGHLFSWSYVRDASRTMGLDRAFLFRVLLSGVAPYASECIRDNAALSTDCPPGFVAASNSASTAVSSPERPSCVPCKANTYSFGYDASSCRPCPDGLVSDEGSSACAFPSNLTFWKVWMASERPLATWLDVHRVSLTSLEFANRSHGLLQSTQHSRRYAAEHDSGMRVVAVCNPRLVRVPFLRINDSMYESAEVCLPCPPIDWNKVVSDTQVFRTACVSDGIRRVIKWVPADSYRPCLNSEGVQSSESWDGSRYGQIQFDVESCQYVDGSSAGLLHSLLILFATSSAVLLTFLIFTCLAYWKLWRSSKRGYGRVAGDEAAARAPMSPEDADELQLIRMYNSVDEMDE
eukprot:ANDGO_07523.mRNA.1 hypothetical protein